MTDTETWFDTDDVQERDAILERTYRRLIEQADALGVAPRDLLADVVPDTAEKLRDYLFRVYDLEW